MDNYNHPMIPHGRQMIMWRACLNALLVLLFAYAVISKLIDYGDFRRQMLNQVFPPSVNLTVYHVLLPAEAATALLLVFPWSNRAGLWMALTLLAAFTGYVTLVMLHAWHRVPCSCGGILGTLKWGPHLALNVFFLAITLVSIYLKRKERRAGER